MKNGHMLAAAAAQAQGPPQIQVAQPINDVQLVALVAATVASKGWTEADPEGGITRQGVARDSVALAVEIVAEAILQMRGGAALPERVRQLMKERSLEQ